MSFITIIYILTFKESEICYLGPVTFLKIVYPLDGQSVQE